MIDQDDFKVALSTFVKHEREKRKWSRHTMAERSDLSENHIANIESGKNIPNAWTLYQLMFAFEVDITKIFAIGNAP